MQGPDAADVLIIGAGISGLLAARCLHDQGKKVIVLEKSRGFGGRMATRTRDQAVFDHGAQYFTVRTHQFQGRVDEWRDDGVVRTWFHNLESIDSLEGHPRYIGKTGMTAPAKYLAKGLDIRRQTRVMGLERNGEQWFAYADADDDFSGRQLLLTAPVPQSLALLETAEVDLPDFADLQARQYLRTLTLLLELDGPSGLPDTGILKWENPEPLLSIADNRLKGISPAPTLTIHMGPQWSTEHYDDPEEDWTRAILDRARPHFQGQVVRQDCHKWRYAFREGGDDRMFYQAPELDLYMAGDGFGAPRVEGAALSGLAVASAMGAGR